MTMMNKKNRNPADMIICTNFYILLATKLYLLTLSEDDSSDEEEPLEFLVDAEVPGIGGILNSAKLFS